MLEGTLYEVMAKEEGRATVHLLPESPIYAAHFPGYPITPGVTIVQTALDLMGRPMKGAKEVKFVSPLFPDERVRYEWSIGPDGRADIQVYRLPDTLCAKMTLSL